MDLNRSSMRHHEGIQSRHARNSQALVTPLVFLAIMSTVSERTMEAKMRCRCGPEGTTSGTLPNYRALSRGSPGYRVGYLPPCGSRLGSLGRRPCRYQDVPVMVGKLQTKLALKVGSDAQGYVRGRGGQAEPVQRATPIAQRKGRTNWLTAKDSL
jgi:hypothetical protein